MKKALVVAIGLSAACAGPQTEQKHEAEPAKVVSSPPPAREARHTMAYPQTRVQDVKDVLFGVSVADPYRWLEDVKADEVQRWMGEQDKLARDAIDKLPGRDVLLARLKALYYVDSISAPRHRGKRFFYTRTHADKEKAIHYWREGEDGPEQVLLDPNTMTKDGTTSIGAVAPSWDGKTLAYSLHANNSDEATLYVKDVATGKISEKDTIEGAKYAGPSWTPAGDGFYYTWLPPVGGKITVADRPGFAEVRFHKLGTDPAKDAVVHEATHDAGTFIGADLSRDGHWLLAYVSHGWNSTDVFYRDMRSKDPAWKPFAVGIDAQFDIDVWKDKFYIRTNDGAPRFRVFVADPKKPARKDWKEIVPESADAVIEGAGVVGGQLLVTWLKSASNQLEVRGLDGKLVRKVALPGIGTAYASGNSEDDTAYYAFASFTQPFQIFRTSIKSGESKLWAEVKVPVDPSPFTVDQVWYPSKDGTKISMFVVHRKDMPKDGSTPFLLGGYGGFNVSMTPSFSSGLYPWLEAGGGYAMPNLRGGGEYGEDWHKAGMGAKKQNVFDDFIAAGDFLVKEGYTRPEHLAIRGGSNGGLLMGAAVTQRPELWRAVICSVPLLDMVRYHLFGSGKTWVPEYGSSEVEGQFQTLFAYSPYHHVKAGTRYPALLMMSADSDDRVDPMHARKMVAALQAANSSEHPILMRIEKHAGHGGADLVKQAVEMSADGYAFLMHELGMTPANK
jgi:prolyl oligopeptidase